MYVILLTNRWTDRKIIYPKLYENSEKAKDEFDEIPYSNKNWKKAVHQLI